MKMKSLLLGAAGMLAATGVQAADLPVAPEPVDYVRVCDAYGTGFFYIPGTETCLRVGGRVRAEYRIWGRDRTNDRIASALGLGAGSRGLRQNYTTTRARAYLRLDARTNTEFGLLRTFIDAWWTADSNSGNGGVSSIQLWSAFIQWGGLTAGRTQSFFDFYLGDTFESVFDQSLSDTRTNVLAYTAAFGNGFSASLSIEDGTFRRNGVLSQRWAVRRFLGLPVAGINRDVYGGHWWPDLVANLRVDQGWGSAQIMAALHDIRDGIGPVDDSELGWAIAAGVTVNLPMLAAGDTISLQVAYADGATSYAAPSSNGWRTMYDAVRDSFGAGVGTLHTTKAWSIGGGFTHFWMPSLSSALTVTYIDIDQWGRIGDSTEWDIQGNLVWRPASGFLIGVEVEYEYVDPRIGNEHDDIVGLLRFERTF